MVIPVDETIYENLDDIFALYYDEENNIFEQEGGWAVYDIFTYVTPSELFLFKNKKEDMFIMNKRHGFVVGLFYPMYDY